MGPDGGRQGLPDRRVLEPGLGHRRHAGGRRGRPAGFTRPDAIWIALWDGKATLDDGTLDWPIGDREKQYAGNLYGTVGGITLSIDRDVVAGPMAR